MAVDITGAAPESSSSESSSSEIEHKLTRFLQGRLEGALRQRGWHTRKVVAFVALSQVDLQIKQIARYVAKAILHARTLKAKSGAKNKAKDAFEVSKVSGTQKASGTQRSSQKSSDEKSGDDKWTRVMSMPLGSAPDITVLDGVSLRPPAGVQKQFATALRHLRHLRPEDMGGTPSPETLIMMARRGAAGYALERTDVERIAAFWRDAPAQLTQAKLRSGPWVVNKLHAGKSGRAWADRVLAELERVELGGVQGRTSSIDGSSAGERVELPRAAELPNVAELPHVAELRSASRRKRANLAAMRLIARTGPVHPGVSVSWSNQERQTLRQYSGWGGLTYTEDELPGELQLDPEALVHEYYSPVAVTEALARKALDLHTISLGRMGGDGGAVGTIRALEPSAGIGRMIEGFVRASPGPIDWTAVEMSEPSAKILDALYPQVQVTNAPLESWVASRGPALVGAFDLVASNPPYGARGATLRLDPIKPAKLWRQKQRAYLYFMMRTLMLLKPGGVGVYIVPPGFLSGMSQSLRAARGYMLRRALLAGAYRLPEDLFPGAKIPVDVVFWVARGGALPEVLEADSYILEGDYYVRHPERILGQESGKAAGRGRGGESLTLGRGYSVQGDFRGLPDLDGWRWDDDAIVGHVTTRSLDTAQRDQERKRPWTPMAGERSYPDQIALAQAAALGSRVSLYLNAMAQVAGDDPKLDAAFAGRQLLVRDLEAWSQAFGSAHQYAPLAERRDDPRLQAFVMGFAPDGQVTKLIATKRERRAVFSGDPNNIAAIATHLARSSHHTDPTTRRVSERQIIGLAQRVGATVFEGLDEKAAAEKIWRALKGDLHPLVLQAEQREFDEDLGRTVIRVPERSLSVPWAWTQKGWMLPEDYYAGDLWARLAQAGKHPAKLSEQIAHLTEVIEPELLTDIDVDPSQTWVPLELVQGWVQDQLSSRSEGGPILARIAGKLYTVQELFTGDQTLGAIRRAGGLFEGLHEHLVVGLEDSVRKGRLDRGYMRHRDAILRRNGLDSMSRRTFLDKREAKELESLQKRYPYGYSTAVEHFLGYVAGDLGRFSYPIPEQVRRAGGTGAWLRQKRRDQVDRWKKDFRAWLAQDADRTKALEDSYNLRFKGVRVPTFSQAPIDILGWRSAREGGKTLRPHQAAGARRVVANRGGLVAFDVGLGKTMTGQAAVAMAKQEGWASRPVICVPPSVLIQWYWATKAALPHWNLGLIGMRPQKRPRYDAQGRLLFKALGSTEEDMRVLARQWAHFKAGLYDCVLCSYNDIWKLPVRDTSIRDFARQFTAMDDLLGPSVRAAAKADQRLHDWDPEADTQALRDKPSLKDKQALEKKLAQKTRAQAMRQLGLEGALAKMIEPPESWAVPEQIYFEDLGIDLMLIDEMQNFKNTFTPSSGRIDGVPKYLGVPTPSKRALNMMLKTWIVRQANGKRFGLGPGREGGGVIGLSATPAKNSPLELFNILLLIDGEIWRQIGITRPNSFIDRFVETAFRWSVKPDQSIEKVTVAAGFKNLHELRQIYFRYADVKTAEDVGLDIPEVEIGSGAPLAVKPTARQLALIKKLVSDIQNDDEGDQILALMSRINQVAMHESLAQRVERRVIDPQTGEQNMVSEPYWTHKNADDQTRPSSPKFEAIADNILAQPGCGHIVFLDQKVLHNWLERTLIARGIKPERIARLTGAVPAKDRLKVAEALNHGHIDILICNKVAEEGIDLQRRTCAIHHADLPWEPASLQQRNGRAVRQGNIHDKVTIWYYFLEKSNDFHKFDLIRGKRGWMVSLTNSLDRETNNPGAGQDEGGLDGGASWMIELAPDPEAMREKLRQAALEKRNEELRVKRATWAGLVAKANALLVQARQASTAPYPQPGLRERIEAWSMRAQDALDELRQVSDLRVWPHLDRVLRALQVESRPVTAINENGVVFFEGDKVFLNNANNPRGSKLHIGRLNLANKPMSRVPGSLFWREDMVQFQARLTTGDRVEYPLGKWHGQELFDAGQSAWPAEDIAALLRGISPLRMSALVSSWRWAADGWVEAHWPLLVRNLPWSAVLDGYLAYAGIDFLPLMIGDQLVPLWRDEAVPTERRGAVEVGGGGDKGDKPLTVSRFLARLEQGTIDKPTGAAARGSRGAYLPAPSRAGWSLFLQAAADAYVAHTQTKAKPALKVNHLESVSIGYFGRVWPGGLASRAKDAAKHAAKNQAQKNRT